MKRLVLAVFYLMVSGYAAAAQTITVAADPWMPYTGSSDSVRLGYCIDIVKEVFEPAGYKVDYRSMAWTRDVADVVSGKVDAIVGSGPMDCRQCLFPKHSIGDTQNFCFVKKGDPWVFDAVGSLVNKRLGVIDGYKYDDGVFDAYIGAGDVPAVQRATGEKALAFNIQKLLAGRLDVLVENDMVIKNALEELGLPGDALVAAGKVNDAQEIFVAFSPVGPERSAKLMQIWDTGIQRLRGSGRLAQIMAKYGLADWVSGLPVKD